MLCQDAQPFAAPVSGAGGPCPRLLCPTTTALHPTGGHSCLKTPPSLAAACDGRSTVMVSDPGSPQLPLPGCGVPGGSHLPPARPLGAPGPALWAAGSGTGWPRDGGFGAAARRFCVSRQESGACFTTGLRQSPQAMAREPGRTPRLQQGVCLAPWAGTGHSRGPAVPETRPGIPALGRSRTRTSLRVGRDPQPCGDGTWGALTPALPLGTSRKSSCHVPFTWARQPASHLHPFPPSIPVPTHLFLPTLLAWPRVHHPSAGAGDVAAPGWHSKHAALTCALGSRGAQRTCHGRVHLNISLAWCHCRSGDRHLWGSIGGRRVKAPCPCSAGCHCSQDPLATGGRNQGDLFFWQRPARAGSQPARQLLPLPRAGWLWCC